MELQLAVLADAANLSAEGKLNILGAFDAIFARSVPVVWPSMVFVAKVELSQSDGEDVLFELRVVSEDGDLVFRAEIQGHLQRVGPPDGVSPCVPIIVPMNHAHFEHFGAYSFELWNRGSRLIGVPLHVRRAGQHPGAG